MTDQLVGDTGEIAQTVPGIPNLVALVAAVAFAANLTFAALLFHRAIDLTNPEHWRKLRQDVNKRDVREAIQVFLGRMKRAIEAHATGSSDLTVIFPDSGEGSADQAIRALLDDARRAMAERRQAEFESALDSIKELVTYAMDEMEQAGMQWGSPGSQPEWPPLRELGRNLYPFREEVIREGSREYVLELLYFDYWLATNGVRRSCGELFSTGISGYRFNYQITTRLGGGEFHEMIRDRFLANLDGLTFGHNPEKLLPFMHEVVRHQERVLSDVLHSSKADDFRWLQQEFSSILSNILQRWNREVRFQTQESEWSVLLTQEHRIALMGLAGRAVILADSGEISDAAPYLDVVRSTHVHTLSGDISAVLQNSHYFFRFYQWEDWEVPQHISGWSGVMSPDRYPLTYFAIRLMELADDATLSLNLRGNARRILDWFVANSERLEQFVQGTSTVTFQQRRERAIEILQEAVRRDEVAEDREIARREISEARVHEFTSGVYSGVRNANSVERLFEQSGAITHPVGDTDDAPVYRGFHRLEPKGFFIDAEEYDRTYYGSIDGEDWGRELSRDAAHKLCEALESAILTTARLDSLENLLRAIDVAVEDLSPQGVIVVTLAGDWGDIGLALYSEEAEGYKPYWQLSEEDPLMVAGRYRGRLILKGTSDGERRLYVFEPSMWGRYIREQFEDGQDLLVEVKTISQERAQELLQANPAYFSDQPDDESKIRKLQTYVEVGVVIRHGFRTTDPSRARKITHGEPLTEPNTCRCQP